ncbi:MAG: MBOAT family protein [Vicinamibacterales bacterium]
MSFISFAFVVFLAITIAARLTLGRRSNAARFLAFLLLASLVFYGWHEPRYLLIVLASAALDYVAAGLIATPGRSPRARRWLLTGSMALNLGLLGFFKYTNFALGTAGDVAAWLGYSRTWMPTLDVVLPIGISFYTFQSMSYTIDVYRGHLQPAPSFARLLLCVTFFPHLVAGPIVRARDLLHQFDRPRRLRLVVVGHAAWLVVRGLFLKMVVADNVGVYLAGVPGGASGAWAAGYVPGADAALLWMAVFMFTIQIFCDFAGYTDIARGVAYLVGIRLPLNFDYPYIATSFSNFWRRWHISLSTWLRDYLYISLGGNRRSRARTYVNLLAVMLIGGLWHGAAWTFVIWGGIHGVALVVERMLGLDRKAVGGWQSTVVTLAWCVVVQFTVMMAWVFFRCDSLEHSLTFVRNLFGGPWHQPALSVEQTFPLLLCLPVVAMHLRTLVDERFKRTAPGPIERAVWATCMSYAVVTLYGRSNEFIYFQF